MTLIKRLRVMLNETSLTADEYSTICDAIRALGGKP